MSRLYENWLDAYLEYMENTESAEVFHKWVGLSMIAAVLRRKVHFNFGRIRLHPNLFIVLVAEPGIARKTQAISFGEDILSNVYGIQLSADSITPQALLEDLEACKDVTVMPDGTQLTHSSLNIYSGEFESFIGNKKENSRMIVTLTDLFDCKARPFKYRTKHSGSNTIPLPFLNLLAATTPSSLANSLPTIAIGGGLTSRIIFVWAGTRSKKIAIPELGAKQKRMAETLLTDLTHIAGLSGGYDFSPEGREWWNDFYDHFDERDERRLCKDPAFIGWYSRKPIFLLKLGTILKAAKSSSNLVGPDEFEQGKYLLEEVERNMGNAFSAVGRSEITADVDLVRKIIQRHGTIAEKQIRHMVWRDIDDRKFFNVIDTIRKTDDVKRTFEGPNKEKGIWYYWQGKECW